MPHPLTPPGCKPIAQAALALGVNEGTLGDWAAKARQAEAGGGGAELTTDERAELARCARTWWSSGCSVMSSSARWTSGGRGAARGVVSPAWFCKWRDGDPSSQYSPRAQLAIEIRRLFAAHAPRRGLARRPILPDPPHTDPATPPTPTE